MSRLLSPGDRGALSPRLPEEMCSAAGAAQTGCGVLLVVRRRGLSNLTVSLYDRRRNSCASHIRRQLCLLETDDVRVAQAYLSQTAGPGNLILYLYSSTVG